MTPQKKVSSVLEVTNGAGPSLTNTAMVRKGWSELPKELLTMILDKLDNRLDLNSCRGVNRYWKSVAIQVGIKQTVALWKPWDPSEGAFQRTIALLPYPTLKLKSFDVRTGFQQAYYPVAFNKFERTSNPFPTNSLCLTSFGPLECLPKTYLENGRVAPGYHKQRNYIELSNLFQICGHHLTYLHLFNMKVHPLQLYSVLEQMPNLEALTLTTVGMGGSPWSYKEEYKYKNVPKNYSPPCTKLTHLRIGNRTNSSLQEKLLEWFESQLISFECDSHPCRFIVKNFPDRNNEEESEYYVPFRKLERLKILLAWDEFYHDIVPFVPIKYLSVVLGQLVDYKDLESILEYVDKLSGTLVHLHLYLEIQYNIHEQIPLQRVYVVFPKLKKFAITDDWESSLLCYFLQRFTKLETLQLMNNSELKHNHDNLDEGELREKMEKRFEDENYWVFCNSLKTIEVHADTLGSEKPGKFLMINRKPTLF
ncbi:unnamed protein product [Orchesella dallaii]|uniref:F-box domain-containing protein n=1 Tax=Orchesella dallaii TaxID=48710 RepID=A0ABP1Q793_9HEXA